MSSCCSRRTLLKAGAAGAAALLASPAAVRSALAATPKLRVGGPPLVGGMRVLSGSLHDHSTDSDGDAASDLIASYVRGHHEELALDFMSLTEHSDFFPVALGGVNPWPRSRAVTDANTGGPFTMLRGFEYTNDQENHLNVIESRNWLAHKDELTMQVFYDWLATSPAGGLDGAGTGVVYGGADGLGQFNHPSSKGALNWDDYAFDPRVAGQMATIEIRERAAGWYWFALSQGWTLGPVQNADYHPWQASGQLATAMPGLRSAQDGKYPYLRTLVVAAENTRAAVLEGLRLRRTTAVEQPDMFATLRGPGDVWQGSTVPGEPGQVIELIVDAGSESSGLSRVEIVTDGVTADFAEFYGPNGPCIPGEPTLDPDFDCNQHTPSYELQRQRFTTSGGEATFKGGKDTPPAGRTLPAIPLSGTRAQVRVPVTVPRTASTRPDGRHFFYAVVTRADGARAITSPVFVDAGVAEPVIPEVPLPLALPLAGLAVAGTAALAARASRGGVERSGDGLPLT